MVYDPNGVLARMRAALPEGHAVVDRIRAGVLAEGLSESVLEFVIQEYSWVVLGRRRRGAVPDMVRWRRWVTFLESEYGRDADLDATIELWFFTGLPELTEQDPPRLREALGPRLGAALDAQVAESERHGPRPDPMADSFLVQLAERFPVLQFYLDESRDGDTLLRTSFLSDVARHVIDLYAEGGDDARRAQEIIDAIEDIYGKSESFDNAIDTGFVEMLPFSYEPHAGLARLFGPRLLHSWQLWQGPLGSGN